MTGNPVFSRFPDQGFEIDSAAGHFRSLAEYVVAEPDFLDACLALPVSDADTDMFDTLATFNVYGIEMEAAGIYPIAAEHDAEALAKVPSVACRKTSVDAVVESRLTTSSRPSPLMSASVGVPQPPGIGIGARTSSPSGSTYPEGSTSMR